MNENPLIEADPNSINQLFSMEPSELTNEQIDSMVVELRKQRESWNATEKAKASKPKAPTTAAAIDDLLRDL